MLEENKETGTYSYAKQMFSHEIVKNRKLVSRPKK